MKYLNLLITSNKKIKSLKKHTMSYFPVLKSAEKKAAKTSAPKPPSPNRTQQRGLANPATGMAKKAMSFGKKGA